MFELVAYPHPFTPERCISRHKAGIRVSEAVKLARGDGHPGIAVIVTVNGVNAMPDDILYDDDIVMVRFAPQGFETIAAISFVAVWLITTALGIYTEYEKATFPEDEKRGGKYSLLSGSNSANPWGKIPFIVGKTYIVPYYAALPYTEYNGVDGGDAYLRMLFVVGYKGLSITDIKLGDNLMASNSAGITTGTLTPDGRYQGAQLYLSQDGTLSSLYEKAVIEQRVGTQLVRVSAARWALTMDASGRSVYINSIPGVDAGPRWDDNGKFTVGMTILFQGWANSGNNHEFEITDMTDDGRTISLGTATGLVNETNRTVTLAVGTTTQTVTIGKRTVSMDVVVTFPSGIGRYTSQTKVLGINHSVGIEARYREKGSTTEFYSCALVGYFDGSTNVITRHREGALRFTATKTGLDPAKEYEVMVRRTIDSTTNSSIVDAVEWTCVRRHTNVDAVDAAIRSKLCLLFVRIKASAGMQGSVPQVSCVAEANYARTGAVDSEALIRAMPRNPAAAYIHALMGDANPRPRTAAQIDWAPLYEWATWCSDNGHECNGIIATGGKLSDTLAAIARTGRATPADRNGLAGIVADIPRASVTQVITPRNSSNFQGSIAWPEQIHGLRIAFINAENDYRDDERVVLDDGYKYDTEGDGVLRDAWGTDQTSNIAYTLATKFEKLSLPLVTLPAQVFADGRYLLAVRRLRPMSLSASMDAEHLAMTRGDKIKVSHDTVLWGTRAARIKSYVYALDLYPATGLYPSAALYPGGNIGGFALDDEVTMTAGSGYQVYIRRAFSSKTFDLTTVPGSSKSVTFETAVTPAMVGVEPGDLAIVGQENLVTTECIVTSIEPEGELGARVSFTEYAAAVFTADSGTIPAYTPKAAPKATGTGASVTDPQDSPAQAAISGVDAIPDIAPRYRGRYANDHPEDRNPGDWWLLYNDAGTGEPMFPATDLYPAETLYPPITYGVYWDDSGDAIQIDTGNEMDEQTRSKVQAALVDVAWSESAGNQTAEDFGLAWMLQAIGASPDLTDSAFAQNLFIGKTLRSGGYDIAGSISSGDKGFFLSSDGTVKGQRCEFVDGTFSGTIEAETGVFKGTLDSPLVGTGQSIAATTVDLPTATYWAGTELTDGILALDSRTDTWEGTIEGMSNSDLNRGVLYFGSWGCKFEKRNFWGTVIDSRFIYPGNYYAQSLAIDTYRLSYPATYYSTGSFDSATFGTYWLGSELIAALVAEGIPQGAAITASGTLTSKTISSFTYTASSVVFTFTDTTTLTILSNSGYQHTATITIPAQGDQTLTVKGSTYESDGALGDVYAANTVLDPGSSVYAGDPWKTLVLQGTAPSSGLFQIAHGISNAFTNHRILSISYGIIGWDSDEDRFGSYATTEGLYILASDTYLSIGAYKASAVHRFVVHYV